MGRISAFLSRLTILLIQSCLFPAMPLFAGAEQNTGTARLQITVSVVPTIQTNTVSLMNSITVGVAAPVGGIVTYNLTSATSSQPASSSGTSSGSSLYDEQVVTTLDLPDGAASLVQTVIVVEH